MRVRKTRELKVNMGDYESFSFGADVTISHHDLGVTDDVLAEMSDDDRKELLTKQLSLLEDTMYECLVQEVEDAKGLTNERRSFILNGLQESKRDQQPRSRTGSKARRRVRNGA